MDAPNHWLKDGETIENIELSRFIGKAVVIDLSHKKADPLSTLRTLEPYAHLFSISCTTYRLGEKYGEDIYFSKFPHITVAAGNGREIGLDRNTIRQYN